MKKYLLILLLLFNCSTFGVKEQEPLPIPSMEMGCSQYDDIRWEKCMVKLLRNKESITHKPPITIDMKESYRISEREIVMKQKTCFGDNVFCYIHYDKKYDPTITYIILNHPITKFAIFVGGVFIGINVG